MHYLLESVADKNSAVKINRTAHSFFSGTSVLHLLNGRNVGTALQMFVAMKRFIH
jgi:hypothetical protein